MYVGPTEIAAQKEGVRNRKQTLLTKGKLYCTSRQRTLDQVLAPTAALSTDDGDSVWVVPLRLEDEALAARPAKFHRLSITLVK